MGKTYENLGLSEKAVPHLRKALELRKREHAANFVLLDRLVAQDVERAATYHFFRGEIYRLRGEEGDVARALSSYREAVAAANAPVRVHRSMGLLQWRSGDHTGARESFVNYLQASPRAADRSIIESYIEKIGG